MLNEGCWPYDASVLNLHMRCVASAVTNSQIGYTQWLHNASVLATHIQNYTKQHILYGECRLAGQRVLPKLSSAPPQMWTRVTYAELDDDNDADDDDD